MLAFLSNPFVLGLLIGLVIAFWIWIVGLIKRHGLKKQLKEIEGKNKTLEGTLSSISANQSKQLDELKELVSNQKVTIQLLQEKPDKKQERELRLYAQAYVLMVDRAPGFAQAWQDCVREIQQKEKEEREGKSVFLKPIQALMSLLAKKPETLPQSQVQSEVQEDHQLK